MIPLALVLQATLHLTAPANTPTTATVYVAGSFNQWNPAAPEYRLTAQSDGRYVITLPDSVRGRIEFKFTLGSWETAELDSAGRDVPNRRFTVPATGAVSYTGTVIGWRDGTPRPRPQPSATASVSILDTGFAMPQLGGRTRRVWLYLPPGYATSRERYPVLYMHDGQNVFDAATSFAGEWGADEALDSLRAQGDRGAIVVAVDNGQQRRLTEYSAWPNQKYGVAAGEGDAYVDFLARTLKPYIDRHYRTLPDRLHTGVAGSSMGGLISLYAALKYPDVFGRVGVFSPAFWFAPEIYVVARRAQPRPGTRIYMVTGGQEGDAPEVYAGDHQRMMDTLAAAGFTIGRDVQGAIRPDGMHAEWFWRREFPAAYQWLFQDAAPPPAAAPSQRQRLTMDADWRFTLGDPANAQRPGFNDSRWRLLDVPHDWSIEGTPRQDAPAGGRGGYFPTGIGWYRKTFRMPAAASGHQAWLEFDGVYMNSDVWINGVHLGRRPYGYISFAYDITKHVRPPPGNNVIAVRVDNSAQPNSRWYTGSGIYRHVWLTIVDPLHVGHWGTYVTTPTADTAAALVVIHTRVENDGRTGRGGVLRTRVLDAEGREVAVTDATFSLAAGQDAGIEHRLPIKAPQLWSVEAPTLYTARSEVLDGGRLVDVITTPFGIRSIAYDRDRGFLLNGRRVKMKGVNLHHDGGGVGAAVPERIWESRLRLLKTMGANAIRTSHNPPAPEFLDLCDRLGFLVMAEAFDEWTIGKVPEGYHRYFSDWAERDVSDFIHRDRNHPSIVLWSAGNEIGEQTTPDGVQVLHRLLDIFHREDPTRPVTTGNDNITADGHPATLAFLNALDIVGYNYVDRWHERREIFAEQDRHEHPDWKMIGTESGSIFQSFDERYSLGDDPAVVRPNYTTGMLQVERLWKWVAMRDYFAGDFMWTGIDYLGESTWPFKGFASGALDITGRPKDAYYLYQSLWTERPVLHVFPHWNWPGREGQVIPVLAYTSCNSVELFLNGRSLGEKRIEFPAQGTAGGWNTYAQPRVYPTTNDLHLSWDVPYEPGELRALGRRRNGEGACVASVRTAGPPAAIRLTADRDTVSAVPGDVEQVNFEIVDSAGTVVPTADNVVRFAVTGGSIVALDNANLRDLDPSQSDHRRAFNGRGLAILRAAGAGPLRVTASADGLRPASLSVVVR